MGNNCKKFIIRAGFFGLFCFLFFALVGSTSVFAETKNANKVESFRLRNYNQCGQKFVEYGKLLGNKDFNQIIDATKRDLAYEATQKALPPDLRKADEAQNYDDPKNFLNYHYSNLCAKFFGSTLFYYGALVLLLLIIIKSLFKK